MAGRNCADIVFCIDASGSMKPCFDAVRRNIADLMIGLQADGQTSWDVRYDFLAFQDNEEGVHGYTSTRLAGVSLINAIYQGKDRDKLFTRNTEELCTALQTRVEIEGDEQQLTALDTAMDFPWRSSGDCHRVVVLLTDEPVETGVFVEKQKAVIDRMIQKAQNKRIKLFIIAPESEAFFELSALDRCEYTDLQNTQDGMRSVDFSKLLQTIGKSVSVSQNYSGGEEEPSPCFGQDEWGSCSNATFTGS